MKSPKILVAEDNPVNRKVALGMLQRLGYEAEVVDNGRDAVEAVIGGHFDLVLMDCQMPEMDGYAATEEIRAREGDGRRTAIVAMTAHAMYGDSERCKAVGMDDYLSKPVSLQTLRETLERWLEAGSDAGQAPQAKPVDAGQLAELRDLMGDEFDGLLRSFLQDATARIDALWQAVEARDLQALEACAHTFKGAASNMGAVRLAGACQSLVAQCREGRVIDPQALVAAIEQAFEATREHLESLDN